MDGSLHIAAVEIHGGPWRGITIVVGYAEYLGCDRHKHGLMSSAAAATLPHTLHSKESFLGVGKGPSEGI